MALYLHKSEMSVDRVDRVKLGRYKVQDLEGKLREESNSRLICILLTSNVCLGVRDLMIKLFFRYLYARRPGDQKATA